MIEDIGKEEIVDGELLNWVNLDLYGIKDEYFNEEEGTTMLNSVPPIEKTCISLN